MDLLLFAINNAFFFFVSLLTNPNNLQFLSVFSLGTTIDSKKDRIYCTFDNLPSTALCNRNMQTRFYLLCCFPILCFRLSVLSFATEL